VQKDFILKEFEFVYTSKEHVKSFNETLDKVARERKYLAKVEGPPLQRSVDFVDYLTSNNYPQYFATDKGKVIAWCDATPYSFEGMNHVAVLGMGVLMEYREMGLGSKLLELTIKHANEKNNIEKIELEVFKRNIGGVKFYKKHNFIIEGEKVKVRKLDGLFDNLYVMGRFL
jgi:ribosomal protein S18 acetylase RimI-like enzyme